MYEFSRAGYLAHVLLVLAALLYIAGCKEERETALFDNKLNRYAPFMIDVAQYNSGNVNSETNRTFISIRTNVSDPTEYLELVETRLQGSSWRLLERRPPESKKFISPPSDLSSLGYRSELEVRYLKDTQVVEIEEIPRT